MRAGRWVGAREQKAEMSAPGRDETGRAGPVDERRDWAVHRAYSVAFPYPLSLVRQR